MAKVDGQPWYWGNADRETVSAALASQEDGSFVVRDASQPGSYTLHVRCKGVTRMARIICSNGKFGFVDTELHNSVEELISYHKTRSLNSFNPDMDACLLVGLPLPPPKRRTSSASSKKKPTPPPTREIPEIREGDREKENRRKERSLEKRREKVPSPPTPQLRGAEASAANPHREIEFDLKLNMERLRISQTALLRTERILTYYQIDYEKAMNLNHNYTKNIVEVTRKITELSDICENQRMNLKTGGLAEKVQESMTTNNQILARSIDRLVAEKEILVEKRTRLQPIYDDLKENYERLRDKLETEIRRREKALAELMGLNRIDIYEMETIIDHLRMMSDKESIDQVAEMVNRPLEWDPESYLVFDHTKTYATKLIEAAKERAEQQGRNSSGIFLIRPSATYPGLMVMDLLAENKICHFLIEQGSEGWGFKDTDTWFITIGDLVRFFTQESLGRYCKGLPAEIYLIEPAIQPKPW